ncbi:MAG: arginine deiminase-related protein [Phycisphaerales bacterium]
MNFQIVPERYQTSQRVLMIRPARFGYHTQAASTNAFMNQSDLDQDQVVRSAALEFDGLVNALRDGGIEVLVHQDTTGLPDCLFPNNWVSWHTTDGHMSNAAAGPAASSAAGSSASQLLVTYPMCDALRRSERSSDVLDAVAEFTGSTPSHLDLTGLEEDAEILEGTGSLVLDRIAGHAFACLSPRTTAAAFDAWCDETGYQPIGFEATDKSGTPIYHTNVFMSVGHRLAVVCSNSITDDTTRQKVIKMLSSEGRQLIDITFEQMNNFCGNILELCDTERRSVFAMSSRALNSFTTDQRAIIESLGSIVHADIPTIENIGGGSVRCMIAELGR